MRSLSTSPSVKFHLLVAALAASAVLLAAGCSKQTSGLGGFDDADGSSPGTAADGTVFGSPCDGNNCLGGLCLDGICQPPGSGSGAGPGFPDPSCENGFDESSPSACQCAPGCISSSLGNGSGNPFSLTDPGTSYDGIAIDPETRELVLQSSSTERAYYIWISNTRQGTVSKINTRTFEEEGRYAMGPEASVQSGAFAKRKDSNGNITNEDCGFGAGNGRGCEDPSRTSVNGAGDVFVGLRSKGGVVKIKGDSERCPDTNGDGMLTTSEGRDDILPYESDDCVLWRTIFPGNKNRVRAVAAQDLKPLDFGETRSFVWVGDDAGSGTIWKLDGETGAILLTINNPPAAPYGMTLDGNGQLWISGRNGTNRSEGGNSQALGRIDTTRCTSDDCGGVPYCNATEDTLCDDAVMQRFEVAQNTYGITVDFSGRIWLAGDNRLYRYIRNGNGRHARISGTTVSECTSVLTSNQGCSTIGLDVDISAFTWVRIERFDDRSYRGITADAGGNIFAARQGGDAWWFNATDPRRNKLVTGTNIDQNSWGMATDVDNRIWVIARGEHNDNNPANRLRMLQQAQPRVFEVPPIPDAPGAEFSLLETSAIDLRGPYTYSDMTGSQLRLATNAGGTYSRVFEGCSEAGEVTTWEAAGWIAQVPAGASMQLYVRSAATLAELAGLEKDEKYIRLAEVPPGTSPASIRALFESSSMTHERFLEVEVRLSAGVEVNGRRLSPRVSALDVGFTCARSGGGLI